MPDDISGPSEDTPTAKLGAQFSQYEEAVKDADNAGDAMQVCMDAAQTFAAIEVEAGDEATGLHSMAKAYLNQLSDTKSGVSRKNVRQIWLDEIDDLETEKKIDDGEVIIFSDLIEETLVGVTKKVTTDKSSTEETEYVLKFNDANGTRLTVTQSTFFEGRVLWKAYTAAQEGEYPDRAESEEVEWDNFIGDVIESVGEVVEEETGARTAAMQALKNYVSNTVAYGDRKDAVENGGVYVDDEPPANSEVVVPREAIASITSTHEITDRALQAEISARELTGTSTAGDKVSKSTTVHGNWQTFWYLSGDAFEVGEDAYQQEASGSTMDRMDNHGNEEDGDSASEPDETGDTDEVVNGDSGGSLPGSDEDSDDHEPGKIRSYTPEDGGDE
ncbi:hypothetical protein [Halorussus pelagicus]|uniref:hypothetical protein n=1 Tax=Halorussus pelagicus TaxID=2505977 RepID=UPI000FFCA63F|nr:hypothetical protein [Halorussus pelagicus]